MFKSLMLLLLIATSSFAIHVPKEILELARIHRLGYEGTGLCYAATLAITALAHSKGLEVKIAHLELFKKKDGKYITHVMPIVKVGSVWWYIDVLHIGDRRYIEYIYPAKKLYDNWWYYEDMTNTWNGANRNKITPPRHYKQFLHFCSGEEINMWVKYIEGNL